MQASDWVQRWAHLIRPNAHILDLACGQGRHMRHLAQQGHRVLGVDRDAATLQTLTSVGDTLCADLENQPWPLDGRQFDAVVVTNYLWRPLWPHVLASLAPGGMLIYETFSAGNETVGRPSRTDFLLQPGELLQRCATLRIVAFEEGFLSPPERFVQRIVAVQNTAMRETPHRYPLHTITSPEKSPVQSR